MCGEARVVCYICSLLLPITCYYTVGITHVTYNDTQCMSYTYVTIYQVDLSTKWIQETLVDDFFVQQQLLFRVLDSQFVADLIGHLDHLIQHLFRVGGRNAETRSRFDQRCGWKAGADRGDAHLQRLTSECDDLARKVDEQRHDRRVVVTVDDETALDQVSSEVGRIASQCLDSAFTFWREKNEVKVMLHES